MGKILIVTTGTQQENESGAPEVGSQIEP